MYQALYRKYRPETFEDVVGQDVIVKTLENAIKLEKISHAYLFTGPRGTGKTTIAKIFANEINKTSPNYKSVDNNVDIIEIDAASNNGVDEIREIRSKVNLVPSNGKYKVYIIDEVHMLTVGAFNALLKTLEEPPAHIIFILATTEPHKIPITILSRCQRFDFKKISIEIIKDRLKKISDNENIKITDEALEEIAKMADGGMRDAISILDQVSSYGDGNLDVDDVYQVSGSVSKEKIEELLGKILSKSLDDTLKLLAKMDEDGKNLVRVMEDSTSYLKDTLVSIVKKEEKKKSKLTELVNPIDIINVIKEFMSALNEMKKYGDPRFIFEITVIKLMVDNKTIEPENLISEREKIEVDKDGSKKDIKEIKIETKEETSSVLNTQNRDVYNKNDVEKIEKQSNETIENIVKQNSIELENNQFDIDRLVKVRINNAFTNISRKILNDLKENLEDVRSYLFDSKYKEIARLILDGEMKAASNDYIIFVFDDIRLVTRFNYSIILIEELLNKIYNKKYNVISVDVDKWEEYKSEYKEKKSKNLKYEFIEEDFDFKQLEKSLEENLNKIENLFGDLIEYK